MLPPARLLGKGYEVTGSSSAFVFGERRGARMPNGPVAPMTLSSSVNPEVGSGIEGGTGIASTVAGLVIEAKMAVAAVEVLSAI